MWTNGAVYAYRVRNGGLKIGAYSGTGVTAQTVGGMRKVFVCNV